jgi:hypothetical protein
MTDQEPRLQRTAALGEERACPSSSRQPASASRRAMCAGGGSPVHAAGPGADSEHSPSSPCTSSPSPGTRWMPRRWQAGGPACSGNGTLGPPVPSGLRRQGQNFRSTNQETNFTSILSGYIHVFVFSIQIHMFS